jgi:hypothetical protein
MPCGLRSRSHVSDTVVPARLARLHSRSSHTSSRADLPQRMCNLSCGGCKSRRRSRRRPLTLPFSIRLILSHEFSSRLKWRSIRRSRKRQFAAEGDFERIPNFTEDRLNYLEDRSPRGDFAGRARRGRSARSGDGSCCPGRKSVHHPCRRRSSRSAQNLRAATIALRCSSRSRRCRCVP